VLVFNQLHFIIEVVSDNVILQDPVTIFVNFFFITHLPHLHYAWKVDLTYSLTVVGVKLQHLQKNVLDEM
jgi:hypothetical protein